MSTVNGFQVGSETLKYNYESLENYNTPEFSTSSSKTYTVGDYVMHNGKLYKCTTATTGGTWNANNWAEAILSDDVTDQKNAIDELTDDVVSVNIFDQLSETTVEGKYLNPNTGNEGANASYCYTEEIIPCKASTTYNGTVWRKTDYYNVGVFNLMVCYYDADGEFLSGATIADGVLTTPANCAGFRFSAPISDWTNYYYMIVEGSSVPDVFVPYYNFKQIKMPYITVSKDGKGTYATIAEAVDNAVDGATIIVFPGTYTEQIEAWGKVVHIIGVDRDTCVLTDASGNYSTPPLEIGAGSLENMTILETGGSSGSDTYGAYAIHVEDSNLYGKTLDIRHCYIQSNSNSAIGMGLRGGCKVTIEDCSLVCTGTKTGLGAAPILFHDADGAAVRGTADLYLIDNILDNRSPDLFAVISANSIHADNTTYLHYIHNVMIRADTNAAPQWFNTWNNAGNDSADGWNGLSKMYLCKDSVGNNLAGVNYDGESVATLKNAIAPTENGTTASKAYVQGAYFFHNTKFCKAIMAIASGATFTFNTNYIETTVAAELLAAQN